MARKRVGTAPTPQNNAAAAQSDPMLPPSPPTGGESGTQLQGGHSAGFRPYKKGVLARHNSELDIS